MDIESARALAAGIAMIGMIGPGIGIGVLSGQALQAIGRNPEAAPLIQTNMILTIALTESIAIYVLVITFVLIFVGI